MLQADPKILKDALSKLKHVPGSSLQRDNSVAKSINLSNPDATDQMKVYSSDSDYSLDMESDAATLVEVATNPSIQKAVRKSR